MTVILPTRIEYPPCLLVWTSVPVITEVKEGLAALVTTLCKYKKYEMYDKNGLGILYKELEDN